MNINHNQAQTLNEIYASGGAVLASEWVRGSGSYVSKRAIPPYCKEMNIDDAVAVLGGKAGKAAKAIKKAHPKARKVIAIVDMHSAARAVK